MYGRARENSDTNFVLLTRNRKQLPHTTIYKQIKRRALIAQLGAEPVRVISSLNKGVRPLCSQPYAFSSDARRKATIEGFDV